MIVDAKSYTAYDGEGNVLTTIQAEDANKDINPIEVRAATDRCISTATTEVNNIKTAINNIEPDANDAIIVQGTKMGPVIEAFTNSLDEITTMLSNKFDELYNSAVAEHNKRQLQYNSDAESEAWSVTGVAKVV